MAAEGFGDKAVEEFGSYPPEVLTADIQRRRQLGQQNGAIVKAWRVAPPGSATLPAPAEAATAARVSSREISEANVSGSLRAEWLRKFRAAAPSDQPAVLARFRAEVLAQGVSV